MSNTRKRTPRVGQVILVREKGTKSWTLVVVTDTDSTGPGFFRYLVSGMTSMTKVFSPYKHEWLP